MDWDFKRFKYEQIFQLMMKQYPMTVSENYQDKNSLSKDRIIAKLKGCVHYIFASLFVGLNESTCQIKQNVFYFTSKPLFVLEKIKF